MTSATVLVAIHVLGAIALFLAAAINFLVHPLSVRCGTISLVFAGLATSIALQEVSPLTSRWKRRGVRLLQTYLGRAVCFLAVAAVVFDRLTDLPCDTQAAPSPYSSAAAKLTVAPGPGGILHNVTTLPAQLPPPPKGKGKGKGKKLARVKGPPSFGTAFYLSAKLAPHCIKIDEVPNQVAGSVAWVNISVNKISRLLVLAACAGTLVVSVIYFALSVLHKSGKVGLSPSMTGTRHDTDSHALERVEVREHAFDQMIKDAGSTYRINLYADDRLYHTRDLYEEQVLPASNKARDRRVDSPASDGSSLRASSIPSSRHLRSINTSQAAECGLNPAQGTASTPEPMFRTEPIDACPPSARAASDTYPRPDPCAQGNKSTVPPSDLALSKGQHQRGRYGYEHGYDRTVDFASGCIMPYPLFQQRKKKEQQQHAAQPQLFPTLLPPDFSRSSPNGASGLTPRRTGKSRVSVSSRATDAEAQHHQAEQRRATSNGGTNSEPRIAVTESVASPSNSTAIKQQHGEQKAVPGQHGAAETDPSQRRLLSPGGLDQPVQWPVSSDKKHHKPKDKSHKNRLKPAEFAQRRLGTAESGRSILSTMSTGSRHPQSRPGTGTSTKSNNSFRLMRRRRGLFATLDLHLGKRLSGISHDASIGGGVSRCSYDSQRSCSAGTFGDGVAGDSSPVSTPRPQKHPLSPSAPTSPSPFAAALAKEPSRSTCPR